MAHCSQSCIAHECASGAPKDSGGCSPDARVETVFSGAQLPLKLHSELLALNVSCVVDLAAGQGTMCMACIDNRTPVLAMTNGDYHAEKLEERLTKYCLEKFQERGHTLFREDCHLGQQKLEKDKDEDHQEEEETPKPKPKPKPPAKKDKKRKSSSVSEEDENKSDEKKNKKKKKKKKSKKNDSSSEEEAWRTKTSTWTCGWLHLHNKAGASTKC